MVLLDITTWWTELVLIEKIYWSIAIVSSFFFLIQLAMTFFGADADIDADFEMSTDMEVETDTGMGFQFFTLKNLLGFFTLFGWTGLGCIDMGLSLLVTLGVSTASGLIMMSIMASIFFFMSKMTDSGTLDVKKALGRTGSVYLVVPGSRASKGKVNVEIQGRTVEMDAITDEEEAIPTGSIITVTEVVNTNLLLVKRQ